MLIRSIPGFISRTPRITKKKLAALDQEYQTSVEKSQSKTLIFADRFPFRYLIDGYNLTYYAAFAGCSAETDASFETITFLAGKLDELNLPAVLTNREFRSESSESSN